MEPEHIAKAKAQLGPAKAGMIDCILEAVAPVLTEQINRIAALEAKLAELEKKASGTKAHGSGLPNISAGRW
jgi:hypothetical protein